MNWLRRFSFRVFNPYAKRMVGLPLSSRGREVQVVLTYCTGFGSRFLSVPRRSPNYFLVGIAREFLEAGYLRGKLTYPTPLRCDQHALTVLATRSGGFDVALESVSRGSSYLYMSVVRFCCWKRKVVSPRAAWRDAHRLVVHNTC